MYAGVFIHGIRDPRELLDYLLTLQRPFKFIIYTNDRSILQPYMDRFNGKLIINYSWGNQHGEEFLAEAVYEGTLNEFLNGWFK